MSVYAVVGVQWGDEGKGRIIDLLSETADIVVRASGGGNTGRTVMREEGKIVLHLVPAGILYPDTVSVIGSGVMLDITSEKGSILKEFEMLDARGIEITPERLKISPRSQLVMPWHIWIDEAEEKKRGEDEIGTTKRGIGPAMSDRVARTGFRTGDLLHEKEFRAKLKSTYQEKRKLLRALYGMRARDLLSYSELEANFLVSRERILPFITDTHAFLWEALDKNAKILLEGSQGVLLDIDLGIDYPFVTSTDVLPSGLAHGSGIPINRIDKVFGVLKAFNTRVAPGPFPTEMSSSEAESLRTFPDSDEFGATTGRPRRCGWLDGVLLRYAVRIAGITTIALTKVDSLACFKNIRVGTAYRKGEKRYLYSDYSVPDTRGVEVEYKEFEGWGDLSDCRVPDDLPSSLRAYVSEVETLAGVPVEILTFGRKKSKTMYLPTWSEFAREKRR